MTLTPFLFNNSHIRESCGAKYMETAAGEVFTYANLLECKLPLYYHHKLNAIDGSTLYLYSYKPPLTDYQYSKHIRKQ